ncbi:MAG: hypothetical protein AABX85_00900 [Nanoarchaeota archaeon]
MGTNKKGKPNNQVNKKINMVERKPLNKVEKLILNTLFKEDIPLTPNALAESSGLAYVTAQKYMIAMEKEGLLILVDKKSPKKTEKGKRSESKKYSLNPGLWN